MHLTEYQLFVQFIYFTFLTLDMKCLYGNCFIFQFSWGHPLSNWGTGYIRMWWKMTLLTTADQMDILGGSWSSLVMIPMLISNAMLIFWVFKIDQCIQIFKAVCCIQCDCHIEATNCLKNLCSPNWRKVASVHNHLIS